MRARRFASPLHVSKKKPQAVEVRDGKSTGQRRLEAACGTQRLEPQACPSRARRRRILAPVGGESQGRARAAKWRQNGPSTALFGHGR